MAGLASRGDTRQLHSDSHGDNGWYVHPPALCNVCNCFGHLARDCRSKLQTCYVCGANNHFMRDCPRNYNRRYDAGNTSV